LPFNPESVLRALRAKANRPIGDAGALPMAARPPSGVVRTPELHRQSGAIAE